MTNDIHETRPQTILRITRQAWDAKAINLTEFSAAVTEAYFRTTPASAINTNLRLPSESNVRQYEKDRANNRQIVDRYIGGAVKTFPGDLEEPWVNSLPEPYRTQALRELAGRYGLLAARVRTTSEGVASVADIASDAGAVLQAMAPIVADGVINESDRPHLKVAMTKLADLAADIASLQAQLAAALPDEPHS